MKNRKILPIILMVWSYLASGLILVLVTMKNRYTALAMVLVALVTLVIYVANIMNACVYKIEDTLQQALWNMLIKLVLIPYHLFMFAMEVGIFSTSFLPGMIFFTPFIVMVFVIIDYCLVLTTSLYGINALIRARKKGAVSMKYMLLHMFLHLLFFFDAISAINVWMKMKKCGNCRVERQPQIHGEGI